MGSHSPAFSLAEGTELLGPFSTMGPFSSQYESPLSTTSTPSLAPRALSEVLGVHEISLGTLAMSSLVLQHPTELHVWGRVGKALPS